MGTIEFAVARPEDDPDLRRLLRDNPMAGEISVSLEREPNVFLAGSVEGDVHQTILARERGCGRPVGMASRSVYSGFLNGEPRRLGYLSQLRVDRHYRGRAGLLSRGYALMRSLRGPSDPPFDLTSIVADNGSARRVLSARLPSLPEYQEIEAFVTVVIPVWRRPNAGRAPGCHIQQGAHGGLDEVSICLGRNRRRYQFAPSWTADDLASRDRSRGLAPEDFLVAVRDNRVVGCLAVWDQRSFKQIVVHGYGRSMRWHRLAAGIAAPVLGTPRLPAPGRPLSHAYVSHVAVDEDDPEVFLELFDAAYDAAHERGFACLVAGFAERHPFLAILRQRYRAWSYASVLYAVLWDAAHVLSLDGRVPHLEVGLL